MSDSKAVFEILMRENADMLLAFLRSAVRDKHAVDDIFQETMIVAWKRLDDFDREQSFGKWIRGIARNLVLAHFRKSGKNPLCVDDESLQWMDRRFEQIQSINGDTLSDKLRILGECVEALSDDNRATIKARYLDQQSLEEIVRSFGVALETIKKRLYRAKSQLNDCISYKLEIQGEST